MALTGYEKLKRFRAKSPKNREYYVTFMRERRAHYRALYASGGIAYEDIPKAYRCFKPSTVTRQSNPS
jgi:hypothetical protein